MIQISNIKSSDFDELSQIYIDTYSHAIIPESWDRETAKNFLIYLYNRQPDMFFVATVDEVLAGAIVGGIKPWWNGNRIYDAEIFVSPMFRTQGVAKKLFQTFLTEGIRIYSITSMESITFDKESYILSWYEKIGLEKSAEFVYISGDAQKILANLFK